MFFVVTKSDVLCCVGPQKPESETAFVGKTLPFSSPKVPFLYITCVQIKFGGNMLQDIELYTKRISPLRGRDALSQH